MKAFLIYTTEPELKALAIAWTREIAENVLEQRQTREQARREAATADSDGNVRMPVTNYAGAKIVQVDLG